MFFSLKRENEMQGIDSLDVSNNCKWCITLTFGEQAENHAGMQMIGYEIEKGLSYLDLSFLKYKLEKEREKKFCKLYNLSNLLENKKDKVGFLIIENGIREIFGEEFLDELTSEISSLKVDKKAFMKGRVVNKQARYNLCFADFSQEPDFENKKGTIVNFKQLPCLSKLREKIQIFTKTSKLVAEENLYYNKSECGIGFHGDSERKIVVGCRLGGNMPFYYQWYQNGVPQGKLFRTTLKHGDMYIMSEKATGHDWKKKKILTLRHAAGSKKYTKVD
jgi:hypothetical protein